MIPKSTRESTRDFFTKEEAGRNLMGGLEVALFMPSARTRFGDDYNEALRSFIIPVLLSPLVLAAVYLYPKPELAHASANTIALLYSLRMAASWGLFLGGVYWLLTHVGRREHFCQFVIAMNWLSIPATAAFLPTVWLLTTGIYSWSELYPFMICTMFYTYAFTAYMATRVLRIPWEFAGFIVLLGMIMNNGASEILTYIGQAL